VVFRFRGSTVIRLLLPLSGIVSFFLLSLATVRLLRPRDPKRFFLAYALLLLVAAGVVYLTLWPLATIDDGLGLVSVLLVQLLACLTMWNAFYSLLWGFSGSMIYDLFNDESLRDRERLIHSYAGDGVVDRILARRLPNLVRGGWVEHQNQTLRLRPKGTAMALGTLAAFKVFSLGMGGGVK
jgi:hypothetical protein